MPKSEVADKALWKANLGDDPWLNNCFYEYLPQSKCEIFSGSNRSDFLVFCGADSESSCHSRSGSSTLRGIYKSYAEAKNSVAAPRDGNSTAKNQCGGTVTGNFRDGLANGQATSVCANGDKFVGEFKNGKIDGQGTFNYANGNRYVGDFRDGKPAGQGVFYFSKGDKYVGGMKDGKLHGYGTYTFVSNDKFVGEFKDGIRSGQGTYTFANGETYVGEFSNDKFHGQGINTKADGRRLEGIWENGKFAREARVTLPNLSNNLASNADRAALERERQQLAEERRRLDDDKRQREQQRRSQRLEMQVTYTQPAADGSFTINVQTNTDTASLKIDNDEEGGKADGRYAIRRVAKAGQASTFLIVATDVYGNTDNKAITVTRTLADSTPTFVRLNPDNVKTRQSGNAVAIIIGIQNYRRVPKAEFANDDARTFYDYAIRALGVKPENIKMLIDEQADEVEVYKAFQQWLPVKVSKQKTDVYVFYSGHGLPSDDGKSLYLLPYGVDKDYLAKTAINQQEIIAALQAVQPKSVTLFMDACYSGQVRTGDTLLASARPIQLRAGPNSFPAEFTVFTASAPDQIASSSTDLKHGIFSYFLMKGMEGDADENKDGKITAAELQGYIEEMVGRQAMTMSRRQQPQLIGDASRVLVGR